MKDVHEISQQRVEPELLRFAVRSSSASGGGAPAAERDAKFHGAGEVELREIRLMHRLAGSVIGYVSENKSDVSVPTEFLAALTANESGGDPRAKRFEPGVYQHLKSVAQGQAASYGCVIKPLLEKEIELQKENGLVPQLGPVPASPAQVGPLQAAFAAESHATEQPAPTPTADAGSHSGSGASVSSAEQGALGDGTSNSLNATTGVHPTVGTNPQSDEPEASNAGAKAESYHAEHLTATFSTSCAPTLSALEDEAIRHLATSWGLTQIMGYHMIGRPEPLEKLCDPVFHYRMAAEMIEQFAAHFHLDPQRDFEALFRCWNTGRPDGKTFDPSYVERGMRRIKICRQLKAATGATASTAAPAP